MGFIFLNTRIPQVSCFHSLSELLSLSKRNTKPRNLKPKDRLYFQGFENGLMTPVIPLVFGITAAIPVS
jgi:hypothetical protein